jgi:hypothetical protein
MNYKSLQIPLASIDLIFFVMLLRSDLIEFSLLVMNENSNLLKIEKNIFSP